MLHRLRKRAQFTKMQLRRRYWRHIVLWYRRALRGMGVWQSPDMDSDGGTLLLTFGGMRRSAGIPTFEFASMTKDMPVKRLFVRDPRQSWYHWGSSKQGTIADMAAALREVIAEHDVERLVVIGNSAGGYAALVFGTLLGADVVLSFSPQTTLDHEALDEMNEHRWDWLLMPLVRKRVLEERWIELRDALPRERHPHTEYKVYFDERNRGDRLHAERLKGLEGIRLYRFGRGGHALVRTLRDCGALERILRQALQVPEPSERGAEPAVGLRDGA